MPTAVIPRIALRSAVSIFRVELVILAMKHDDYISRLQEAETRRRNRTKASPMSKSPLGAGRTPDKSVDPESRPSGARRQAFIRVPSSS